MSVSKVRQNFHQESEAGLNKQINMELYASYAYQSMVSVLYFMYIHLLLKISCDLQLSSDTLYNSHTYFW